MPTLEEAIRENSRALGFSLVGIARAAEADDYALYQAWVAQGFAGEMRYLTDRPSLRQHPRSILAQVQSVIMVAMDYAEVRFHLSPPDTGRTSNSPPQTSQDPAFPAKIARYAVGDDYHAVLRERLHRLLIWLKTERPACEGRVVVDTAPLLERDFARRAGLGWIGKNTMLINKRLGSYFFLGALLTNLELTPDSPHTAAHCGTCTACLEACPTSAFVQPGQLDARRCISYFTIELRGPIPSELRNSTYGWVFGCDICQEVCPWNRNSDLQVGYVDALEMLRITENDFRERFRGTPLLRAKRSGLARNAAIHLGNSGDPSAIPALEQARSDPDPAVREAAEWALSRLVKRSVPTNH